MTKQARQDWLLSASATAAALAIPAWSVAAGSTWSEPQSISTDGAASDLGYPSTVELRGYPRSGI